MFSNPEGKVIICVEIYWSKDLRGVNILLLNAKIGVKNYDPAEKGVFQLRCSPSGVSGEI